LASLVTAVFVEWDWIKLLMLFKNIIKF